MTHLRKGVGLAQCSRALGRAVVERTSGVRAAAHTHTHADRKRSGVLPPQRHTAWALACGQRRSYATKAAPKTKPSPEEVILVGDDPQGTGELTWVDKLAKNLGWLGGFYSRRQVIMRSARRTYLSCAEHASGDELYEICQLPDTFQSWFLVQQLHVWMCLVRLKADGSDGKAYHKQMIQYFWEDVEYRMRLMKVDDRNIQSETTRELLSMFYGLVFAYDEGLAAGDDVLAAAVWRNLFHASRAQATAQDVALVVEYIRREVQALDAVETEHLMSRGGVRFGPMPSVIPRPDAEISDEQRERAAARARAKEAVMRESS